MDIKDLNFRRDTYIVLKEAGINLKEDIERFTEKDLLKIKNIGARRLLEIKEKVHLKPDDKKVKKIPANKAMIKLLKKLFYCSDVYHNQYGGSVSMLDRDLKFTKHYACWGYLHRLCEHICRPLKIINYRPRCEFLNYTEQDALEFEREIMSIKGDSWGEIYDYYYHKQKCFYKMKNIIIISNSNI